jgi:hypothetical protein
MFGKRKSQAVLEYIIVLTAVVVGFLAAKTIIQNRTQGMLEHAINEAGDVVDAISFLE